MCSVPNVLILLRRFKTAPFMIPWFHSEICLVTKVSSEFHSYKARLSTTVVKCFVVTQFAVVYLTKYSIGLRSSLWSIFLYSDNVPSNRIFDFKQVPEDDGAMKNDKQTMIHAQKMPTFDHPFKPHR
jgi:hypothetical protein